jgi:hypothetical protein
MISSLSVSELVVKGTSLDVTIVDSVSFKIEQDSWSRWRIWIG